MSLIFASNWQELLSKMFTPMVYNPVPFNYCDDNRALTKCVRTASLQLTALIPGVEPCLSSDMESEPFQTKFCPVQRLGPRAPTRPVRICFHFTHIGLILCTRKNYSGFLVNDSGNIIYIHCCINYSNSVFKINLAK